MFSNADYIFASLAAKGASNSIENNSRTITLSSWCAIFELSIFEFILLLLELLFIARLYNISSLTSHLPGAVRSAVR